MTMVTKSRGMVEAAADLAALEHHAAIVRRGLQTFAEVGNSLIAIKIGKLYKTAAYDTFDSYCEAEFGLRSSQRVRLMTAAATHEELVRDLVELAPMGAFPEPTSERQIRPLATLPPEDRADAWIAAVESANGQPTASDVQAAVDKIRPPVAGPSTPTHGVEDQPAGEDALQFSPAPIAATTPTGGSATAGDARPPAASPAVTLDEPITPDAVIPPKPKTSKPTQTAEQTRAANREHDIAEWAKHLRGVAAGWSWFMRINDMSKSISGDVFDRLTEAEQQTLLRISKQLDGVMKS